MAARGSGPTPTLSGLSVCAFRLGPGEELRSSLVERAKAAGMGAAFVVTCVGSVRRATLRMANAAPGVPNTVRELEGPFEIVSLVGTLAGDGCHLHASLSDKDGAVCGGHVVGGMEVYTTAEVVLGHCVDAAFTREPDAATGYDELVVRARA